MGGGINYEKINEYLDKLKVGDVFWIKDGSSLGNFDLYHKWEIMEREEFHTMNHGNFLDITIYVSRMVKLYNKYHGFVTYVFNYHHGQSEGENRLLRANKNNERFKYLHNNKYDDYYEILTQKDIELINEKEKNKSIKEYVEYCQREGVMPNIPNDNKGVFLHTIPVLETL